MSVATDGMSIFTRMLGAPVSRTPFLKALERAEMPAAEALAAVRAGNFETAIRKNVQAFNTIDIGLPPATARERLRHRWHSRPGIRVRALETAGDSANLLMNANVKMDILKDGRIPELVYPHNPYMRMPVERLVADGLAGIRRAADITIDSAPKSRISW